MILNLTTIQPQYSPQSLLTTGAGGNAFPAISDMLPKLSRTLDLAANFSPKFVCLPRLNPHPPRPASPTHPFPNFASPPYDPLANPKRTSPTTTLEIKSCPDITGSKLWNGQCGNGYCVCGEKQQQLKGIGNRQAGAGL